MLTFGTDSMQADADTLDEIQTLLDIVHFVNSHLSFLHLWQLLVGNDFQESLEVFAIMECCLDILDLQSNFPQVTIDPQSKGLVQVERRDDKAFP